MAEGGSPEGPVLHVVVVGFHHKKGCQVEYSYPPLIEGDTVDSHEVPAEWKHLPSLALPDGAHNYEKDTIFFHLKSRGDSNKTVYGVSCYRQMDAKDLVNKTADVTRSTVQKSVCVLSKLPLYSLIQTKLELITHAYFEQGDFTIVSLLEDTYKNLNQSLGASSMDGAQVFLGLSARDLVLTYKHKIMLLVKLMLLERKVLFFMSPVKTLCNVILSLLSLFPGLVECGLNEAASYSLHRQISPTMKPMNYADGSDDFMEVKYTDKTTDGTQNSDIQVESKTNKNGLVEENSRPRAGSDLLFKEDHFDGDDILQKKCQGENVKGQGHMPGQGQNSNLDSTSSSTFYVGLEDDEILNSNWKTENKLSPLIIENITHFEQPQEPDTLKPDCSILEHSPNRNLSEDPLGNIEDFTKIQSVQGQGHNSRSRSKSPSPVKSASPKTPGTPASVHSLSASKMQDLDSPESLLQIDSEDNCFSWEDDKVLLEIKPEDDPSMSIEDAMESLISEPEIINMDREVEIESADKQENFDSLNIDITKEVKLTDDGDIKNDDQKTGLARSDSKGSSSSVGSNVSAKAIKDKLSLALRSLSAEEEESPNSPTRKQVQVRPMSPTNIDTDECGFPLSIFAKGSLCHPYLCLHFYDLLEDVNVRSFVIGATNVLFKQKRHLTDVVVEHDETSIDIHDNELKKQLNLTTADLRFADYIVKTVEGDQDRDGDAELYDGTSWEGGDEWLRCQIKLYIMSLLATVQYGDEKLIEDFGRSFVSAWKTTHNYRVWCNSHHPEINAMEAGHPFHGSLSMSDMKLKIATSLQSTERGRKVNAAMVNTGKAVGGAISSAKSAVSSWFSGLTSQDKK